MVEPPLPLLKQKLNHMSLVYRDYIICQPYMYQTVPLSYQYLTHVSSNQGHIPVIQIWGKHENPDLPPLS